MYSLLMNFILRNVPDPREEEQNNSSIDESSVDYDDHQTFGVSG